MLIDSFFGFLGISWVYSEFSCGNDAQMLDGAVEEELTIAWWLGIFHCSISLGDWESASGADVSRFQASFLPF